MGYVFNFTDAEDAEQAYALPKNRLAADLEKRMLLRMLTPIRRETALDIGCGAGHSLASLLENGFQVTGLDASPYMIDKARKTLGHRAELHTGFAEDLPYDDNSFNHACIIKTLEFVEDPEKAVAEACRVAKDTVFIGIYNRHSVSVTGLRVKRMFANSVFKHARFFTLWNVLAMIRRLAGDVPVSWRSICQFSSAPGKIAYWFERSRMAEKCPFGFFTGVHVILTPRYRTRPLELPLPAEPTGPSVAGLARSKWR